MRYKAYYLEIVNCDSCKSIKESKNHIEQLLIGYNFADYETARIDEFNFIGRNVATNYFSMNDKKWHRSENKIINHHSWNSAVSPIREIAQWILEVLGFRAEQEKRMRDFVQKKEIDKLYGR